METTPVIIVPNDKFGDVEKVISNHFQENKNICISWTCTDKNDILIVKRITIVFFL